jgi:hypothetical protein
VRFGGGLTARGVESMGEMGGGVGLQDGHASFGMIEAFEEEWITL